MTHSDATEADRRLGDIVRSWMPATLAVTLSALAIGALLYWSTNAADRISLERQRRLVSTVLEQSIARIPHDQESVTVWDDSIQRLRARPLDMDWLDGNLGIWLHSYYGHDASYVLDAGNQPLYAMVNGARGNPRQDFQRVSASVMPLVRELRARLRSGTREHLPSNILSPGVADVVVADGHPAIVSVKPHRSDTGNIRQVPGTEFLHISVRRLDSSFVREVRAAYDFAGARFSWSDTLGPSEASMPWRSRDGRVVGYFIWTPFTPGSTVFARLAPGLIIGFLILGFLISRLILRVRNRTRQLHDSRAAAQHLAFHDTLTGLPNRALFDDRLDHALAIFRGTAEHRVALLYLDLDRFKKVNDTLGHPAGDELIREFARRLATIVRVNDTAARLGGDEFAIIQTDVSTFAETDALCARIIEAASRPFLIGGSQVFVGVSIGVALAGKDGLDPIELTRKADIALYQSKAEGRGRFKLFSPKMDEPIRARQAAERDLRAALESGDELKVDYQPQYSAETGKITGVEALVRWDHPENGRMSPTAFIPIAEETGLIQQLGEWVLTEACRAASDWPVDLLSVNVSPIQLRNPHFAHRVLAIIGEAGFDPGRLELEITETALIESAAECAVNLRLLRSFGVGVALDDFGTGYSSFSHLREFEVDRVKIDRTFVNKIDPAKGGSAIIQAIVDLAHSTGLQTTAEGVESLEQLGFLKTIGCDEIQGYLMASPMSGAEMGKLLGAGAEKPRLVTAAPPPRRSRRKAG